MKTQIIKSSIRLFSQSALACLCWLAVTSLYAADNNESPGQLSSSDYKFACAAGRGGTMEVKLGNLAAVRASDSAIQQFGQRMVQDHGKAGDQLRQIATSKGAMLPVELTKSQQAEVKKLDDLSGEAFDKAYLALMVKEHKAALKEFQEASMNAQDADLKSFATTTVPIIQEHLKMAESLKAGEKVASIDSK